MEKEVENGSGQLNPIGVGVKLFLVDSGISASIFLIAGTILLICGFTVNDILNNKILDLIGLVISMYAAFLLYKNYSKDKRALAAIIGAAILSSVLDIAFQSLAHRLMDPTTQVVSLVTDLVAYCFGWYLAATTDIKIFLLGKKWTNAFFVIGIILLVLGWLSLI